MDRIFELREQLSLAQSAGDEQGIEQVRERLRTGWAN